MTASAADRFVAAVLGLADDQPVRGLGLFERANRPTARLARSA